MRISRRLRTKLASCLGLSSPKTTDAKANFAHIPDLAPTVLEFGPFNKPCVRGQNVRYFDVLTKDQLVTRAQNLGFPSENIPEIHYVSDTADLSIVGCRFAAVVSSHCIEHQPDLIKHLQQVADTLTPEGRYWLIVPDHRYCFDHAIPPTRLDEVLDARGRSRQPMIKVIEHRAFTTHNDPARHWRGDHFDAGWAASILDRTRAAIAEFDAANGGYIDVHSWQFTPASFTEIIQGLSDLGLAPFKVIEVNDTPVNRFEFSAVLEVTSPLRA